MTEMDKLEKKIKEYGLIYDRRPLWGGEQIIVYTDNARVDILDDVVCHEYSHGGDKGLLETALLGNYAGFETADDVFKGWKRMYHEYNFKPEV